MCTVLPEIFEPDLVVLLVTMMPMYDGSGPFGGFALLPGPVVQSTPQLGVAGVAAKPLKLAGAGPPLSVLSFHHCAPQKVTCVPLALLPSPITNGTALKISTVQPEAVAVLPPSSLIETVIV